MKTLNDPVPLDDAPGRQWTPTRGLIRATIWTTVTALILAGVLGLAAYYAPQLVLRGLLRAALGFGVAWVLFCVAQRTAGMVGERVTALVIALTLAVLLSNHVVFAVHGVLTARQIVVGWSYWFDPTLLALSNYPAVIAMAGCVWLCHSGGADAGTLVDILTRGIWGARR